jgi:outer membrane protein insertion porin family
LRKKYLYLLIGTIAFYLVGCGNTRYLPNGEELYVGSTVKIISEDNIPHKNALQTELENVLKPAPNKSFLGLRPGLWMYNVTGEPRKEKGSVRRWVRNNLGQAPVLLSEVSTASNLRLIQNRLENNGYFDPQLSFNINRKNQRASIEYHVNISRPYLIKNVELPKGKSEIEQQIRKISTESLLKSGDAYNLSLFIEERHRIDERLKEVGFFYFNPDFIIFRVDSSLGSREVNIIVDLKRDMPANAKQVYQFRNIYVNTDFSLNAVGQDLVKMDTIKMNGFSILTSNHDIKPIVFERVIFLRSGERYSRKNHEITLSHLMGLGIFQFANIRFEEVSTAADSSLLDAYINLTQSEKRSIRLELRAVSKSNNFAGPGFNVNFRNRNTFRGAELFMVNLRSSYETVISGIQRGLNSYEVGATSEIQIPRFIAPFNVNPDRPIRNIPRTRMLLGYSLLNRVEYFWLNSFNTTFGYMWSETIAKRHELNLISINYVRLGNTSPRFDSILDRNPILRRSFEEQLIFGSNYTYFYNDQLKEKRKHNFFFMANFDVAGNFLYLLQSALTQHFPSEENPHQIIGRPYAQYARGEVDFRHYYQTSKNTRLVSRLVAGTGFAYGNTNTLPYIKQFFIGGANSIRAFAPRSLGPGTYRAVVPADRQVLFLDQIGDIKLEGNLEYRFPVFNILKGSIFLDGGNIWTYRPNESLVNLETNEIEGVFKLSEFYTEIAAGTGAGLRLDANFFVLRLDLGIPIRKPWLEENQRWVIHKISFGNPEWRRDNLVLNIAIGYPF